jgi:5'-nucleotidase
MKIISTSWLLGAVMVSTSVGANTSLTILHTNDFHSRVEPILIDGSVPENTEIVARVAELAKPLDAIRNKVVAESAAMIEDNRDVCRVEECALDNLVADAMLARVY